MMLHYINFLLLKMSSKLKHKREIKLPRKKFVKQIYLGKYFNDTAELRKIYRGKLDIK